MVDHSSVQSVKLNVRAFRGRYRALHLHSFIIRPDLFSSIRACSSVRPDGSELHRVLPSGSEERSDAQRRLPREHGEHRIFPAVKLATCGIAQHLYQGPKRLTALGWAICLTVMAGPCPRALTLGLARPSTAAVGNTRKDVDGRHRAGHDDWAVLIAGKSILPRPGITAHGQSKFRCQIDLSGGTIPEFKKIGASPQLKCWRTSSAMWRSSGGGSLATTV